MPKKTGGKTGRGHFLKGHDPRRGHGKKGRSGRPRKEFTQWCRDKFDSPQGLRILWRMAQREASVMNRLLAYAHGMPEESVELKLKGMLRIIVDEK